MPTLYRVLLTGANGYIAQHILAQLLETGHSVLGVVRSQSKVEALTKTFGRYINTPQLDFSIVPDITTPGAFDTVLQSTPPFDIVLHTASPFFFRATRGADFLHPAIKGTTEILEGIARVAPSVKRVVVTSSFAAIGDMGGSPISNPPRIYTRDDWNPVTMEQAMETEDPMITYPASKTFAEKAAWDFVKEGKGDFELATINSAYVVGPLYDPSQIATLEGINESVARIYKLLLHPDRKPSDPVPASLIYLWADVRDVARAHLLAMTRPEAAGKRWFVTAGDLGMQQIVNYLREALPEKRDTIPIGDPKKLEKPEGWYGASAPETERVLGLKYISAEESIKDLAPQLLEIEKRDAASP
ncbi:NAD dependent epimerase/dehydratase [Hypomontagnella monticulosa]|nr:NAD dependent epimerase/dehydratase [Hypomontagnella monticulosa]